MKKKLYKFEVEDEEISSGDISTLSRRKTGAKGPVFLFIAISLFTVIFSGWYFYGGLSEPFKFETPEWLKDLQNTEEEQTASIVELRNKDTDQDGLNDFEEIYQYGTSIFLEDSDSDTYSDYEEVTTGNDPLCLAGQECGLLRLITPRTKLAEVVQNSGIDPSIDLQTAILSDFRKALVDGGIPQEEVDKWTDDDLIELYESMANNTDLGEASTGEITPEEVRNFLLSQPGVDVNEINALSDEELLEIGHQLMGEENTSQ
ncbi:hypothetical protein C4566_01740 [Candidatus Parcubacteria bacterium]|nr:MAG: hypothetical protein C4566_01740 [Candidatus Parcubacteria bacterium]